MASSSSSSTTKYPRSPPTPTSEPLPDHFSTTDGTFKYDAFLSFRGKDTRNNFTGHLYHRLVLAGIRTFMDDDEIQIGRDIYCDLFLAIKQSKTRIVVFSKNYASSTWCLKELVQILRCKNSFQDRALIPVFYDVEPSEVREQKGTFEEAFRHHEAAFPNAVNKWREALAEAANISGFHLQGNALGSESRLISMIVKEVLSKVKPHKLFIAKHPVGLDYRINDVYKVLKVKSFNHRDHLLGVWGMGGSGKTVIAKALYNTINHLFDSSCFLANVRELSQQPNGLLYLQENLIIELLRQKSFKVSNVDRGMEMIRERFCRMKVLIVLDDLDHLSQADALAGHRNWFGRGSLIIITTRDQHLLNQVQVDKRYEAKGLNSGESLELFSWHSFKNRYPPKHYVSLACKMVAYSCGLPLALEVLGSYLFGKTVQEWNSAFEKVQRIPPNGIQEVLKISYDGLDDDEQRDMFLDIAFFFIGMDIDHVTEILDGCAFHAKIDIGVLIDRCLLSVDRYNELRMHDLLRDMGREIVRQPFPREPSKRSRLWSYEDATNALMKNKGTEAIEGVALISPIKEEIHLNTENFAKMHKLRLLQMDNVNLDGSFEHISKEIRWISWHDCSLEYLPPNLLMENLVALDMQHNKMSIVWHSVPFLRHLKILNLSHSKCLTSTPDFRRVPNLLTLVLEGCTSLLQIDPSIGCLASLLVLNLKGCEKITNIPSEVCSLGILEYVNLNGCLNIKELPENLGNVRCLREFYADETAITELPSSFYRLKNLRSLSLRGCNNLRAGPWLSRETSGSSRDELLRQEKILCSNPLILDPKMYNKLI